MKSLFFSQNIFSAPALLAHGHIARDLERFGEILEMTGMESLGILLSVFALLMNSSMLQNWTSKKASKKGLAGMLNLALRIAIVCSSDNIIEYMVGTMKAAL